MPEDQDSTRIDSIAGIVKQILDSGKRAVLATIVETGSASLKIGDKLIAIEDEPHVGTLGDSQLEAAVHRRAVEFVASREDAKLFKVSEFAPELCDLADAKILFERIEAEPRLVIAGAGHVGAALARLAALVGYRVTLIDDRAEFVERDLFASPREESIKLVAATDWQNAMRTAIDNGRGVAVAIVTRGHKQDEDCLRAAVSARPDYIGMIGSKRRTNIVLQKLREEGFDENELEKVRAPIGLDIGAVSPEEVALAILSEVVAERRGGTGAALSGWRRS